MVPQWRLVAAAVGERDHPVGVDGADHIPARWTLSPRSATQDLDGDAARPAPGIPADSPVPFQVVEHSLNGATIATEGLGELTRVDIDETEPVGVI
jgi:hypothetical protein